MLYIYKRPDHSEASMAMAPPHSASATVEYEDSELGPPCCDFTVRGRPVRNAGLFECPPIFSNSSQWCGADAHGISSLPIRRDITAAPIPCSATSHAVPIPFNAEGGLELELHDRYGEHGEPKRALVPNVHFKFYHVFFNEEENSFILEPSEPDQPSHAANAPVLTPPSPH